MKIGAALKKRRFLIILILAACFIAHKIVMVFFPFAEKITTIWLTGFMSSALSYLISLSFVVAILHVLGIADILKFARKFSKTASWLTAENEASEFLEVYFGAGSNGVYRRGVVMNEFQEPALNDKTMCSVLELHPLSQSGHVFVIERESLIYTGRHIPDLFAEISSYGINRKEFEQNPSI